MFSVECFPVLFVKGKSGRRIEFAFSRICIKIVMPEATHKLVPEKEDSVPSGEKRIKLILVTVLSLILDCVRLKSVKTCYQSER